MTVFQVTLLIVFGALLGLTVTTIARGRLAPRAGSVWVAIWIVGLVAAAFPDLTTIVAQSVGINRGTDLVLYLGVLVVLIGFFTVYLRLRRLRRELTLVVRHLALREVNHKADGEDETPQAAS